MLKDFSRSSSSASSFASVVEETEGVDGDDTGLVRGPPGDWGCCVLAWRGGSLVPGDALGRSRSLVVAEMRSGTQPEGVTQKPAMAPQCTPPYSEACHGSPVRPCTEPNL